MNSMKTIVFSNLKGGVAKTTSALAMCSGLAKKGKRVLLIDADPQCNATFGSGIDAGAVEHTLEGVFEKTATLQECITPTEMGFDIVAGSIRLTVADLRYSGRAGREYILKKAMDKLNKDYDYIIIDTNPTVGLLVENALVCADEIIIPINADPYSLQGLSYYLDILNSLRTDLDCTFEIRGLLITRWKPSTLANELLEVIKKVGNHYAIPVFVPAIRETVQVSKAVLMQESIFEFAPKATATEDYQSFIDAYMKEEKKRR